jgi:regulatory protein
MGKITKINQQKKKKNRVNIYIDGEFSLSLYKDTAIKYHLYENKELTPTEISSIKKFEEITEAKEKARNYISYRERSKKEIKDYLINKGIREEVAEKVLADFEEASLIDDQRFATVWIKDRNKNNPKGNFALKMELKDKGIEEEQIESLLLSIDEKENALKVFEKAIKKYGRNKNSKKKIFQYLKRRGFKTRTILEVLQEQLSS